MMTDAEADAALANPGLPAGFKVPPGMPVPTAENVDPAGSHHAGIADHPPSEGFSIPWWAWAIGGVTIVGGIGLYVSYHAAKKVAPLLLAYHAPDAFGHYQEFQRARDAGDNAARDIALQNMVVGMAR